MMNNLNELYDAILVGKLEDAVKVTKIAVEEGMTPHEIINQYMIKAMRKSEVVLRLVKFLFRIF